MAKQGKAGREAERRAVLDQIRRDEQRAERRRTWAIIGACALVGLVIIGLGAYPLIQDKLTADKLEATDLSSIGADAEAAGCQPVRTAKATGSAVHKPEGEKLFYPDAPPASGPHFAVAAPMERKFYTSEDRPELGYLVHNLEHGYNVLWYDETVADDEDLLADVEAIAGKFPGTSTLENKFIAAPWTAEDGEAFPDEAHVALTHWSLGGTNGNPEGQQSIWQFCAAPSGEAVAEFVKDYPYSDSPEPNAA